MGYLVLFSRCLAGTVFAVSAFSKLRSRPAFRQFADWLAGVPGLPARPRPATAVGLAGTEATAVLLLALPWTAPAGLALAAVTLAVFTAGAFRVARAEVRMPCQCFGTSQTPIGMRHVARNATLCAVAVAGFAAVVTDPTATRPAGVALSLAAAAVTALFVVFLDDLAALLADPSTAAGNAHGQGPR